LRSRCEGAVMTDRRFLVEPDQIATGFADVTGSEHHHLSRVLRLKRGDAVSVFDGSGEGRLGVIASIEKNRTVVRLTASDPRAVEPRLHLTLAQGIPRHDKMDLVIQMTTEAGVAAIVPIVAERSVARVHLWGGGASRSVERWRRITREAARQSGRLRIPEVSDPMTWSDLARTPGRDPDSARLVFVADSREATPTGLGCLSRTTRSAVIAVGPEGGWSPAEVAVARECGFIPACLGPRVLRTETAGIVAVALALFLAGDLQPAFWPASTR